MKPRRVELRFTIERNLWETTKANGSHGHWSKQAGARKQLRQTAGWTAKAHRHQPLKTPCRCIAYIQYPTKAEADPANAAGTVKPLIDGIVDAGLIKDDSSQHLIGPDYRRDKGRSLPGFHDIRLVFTELTDGDHE